MLWPQLNIIMQPNILPKLKTKTAAIATVLYGFFG
ncbi:hypothetical protein CPS_4107 [Colwellia psychrerythraea 34H]|uniref:Uncharacterized protein n=1 Tax=Colwellia psychrerythraea (strain 34H / ATCC BAA-681) TaxID=167879 RepID=Q47WR0_COLP3|nr:hypothetical protein CPS_4107 [Colwellia psychrerythraea 34H]